MSVLFAKETFKERAASRMIDVFNDFAFAICASMILRKIVFGIQVVCRMGDGLFKSLYDVQC